MNKRELVDAIAESTGQTKDSITTTITEFLNIIRTTVNEGESVVLKGFGTFKRTNRKEKSVPMPMTGKMITIPSKKIPKFQISQNWKTECEKANAVHME